jgi:hypothetical protein
MNLRTRLSARRNITRLHSCNFECSGIRDWPPFRYVRIHRIDVRHRATQGCVIRAKVSVAEVQRCPLSLGGDGSPRETVLDWASSPGVCSHNVDLSFSGPQPLRSSGSGAHFAVRRTLSSLPCRQTRRTPIANA